MQEIETTYSIGEVAEKFGLSVPTLRYYDKEGLIPNLNKNAAGVRRFTEENLSTLQIVECVKNAGMPIKEIKQFKATSRYKNALICSYNYVYRFKNKCANYKKHSMSSILNVNIMVRQLMMVRKSTLRKKCI